MSIRHPIPSFDLDALRRDVRRIEKGGASAAAGCLPFGIDAVDGRLASGGIAAGALHEIAGAGPGFGDDATAVLFAAGIAARAAGGSGTVLWVLSRRDMYAPALAQAGLAPSRLIYAECGRNEEILAAMEEGVRHGGLAAVVGEASRAGMASSRRLQLAAEKSGTTVLMLTKWRREGADPLAAPSPAATRWRIGGVPSEPLPVPGIGRPRWRVELVRQRGGAPHQWLLEGNDAEGRLALPAEPRDRPAADRGEGKRTA